jgi:lipopolysaccharide export system protein LptC
MTHAADVIRDRRRVFAAPGGAHDRVVRFLARWLPAGIGILAAIMILSPLSQRSEINFLLDRNRVSVTNERLRVEQATYRGLDNRSRPFTVIAGSAVQKSALVPVVQMKDLSARIQLGDGPGMILAAGGAYDYSKELLTADGEVNFRASDGFHMATSGVTIDLRQRLVTGASGVAGTVPAGTFSAERIIANLDERSVALEGNARLHMVPGKIRMPQ